MSAFAVVKPPDDQVRFGTRNGDVPRILNDCLRRGKAAVEIFEKTAIRLQIFAHRPFQAPRLDRDQFWFHVWKRGPGPRCCERKCAIKIPGASDGCRLRAYVTKK